MQARSRLYARRVKGDLDLGLEPARIDSQLNRHWAEILTPGGLLPGGSEQGIHETGPNQNYRSGTRRVVDDREFRYCFAPVEPVLGGAPNAQIGAFTQSNLVYEGDGAQPVVTVGTTEFDYTTAEAIAAHALQEGFFCGYGERAFYRIADNDLAAGGACHIYLKYPIWNQIGGGATRFYCYPNIYQNTVWPDPARLNLQGWASVVCVPLVNPAVLDYYWGQTWGPIPLINGTWGNLVGQTVNEREFHFDWDGRIVYRGAGVAMDAHMQRGGYLLMDGREATGGDQMCYLQLTP